MLIDVSDDDIVPFRTYAPSSQPAERMPKVRIRPDRLDPAGDVQGAIVSLLPRTAFSEHTVLWVADRCGGAQPTPRQRFGRLPGLLKFIPGTKSWWDQSDCSRGL